MKKIFLLLFIIISSATSNDTFNIDKLDLIDCKKNIQLFYDFNMTYGINNPPEQSKFVKTNKTSLSHQFYPVWSKLTLKNNLGKKEKILLANPRVGMDELVVFIYKNDVLVQKELLGDMIPIDKKNFYHRYSILELTLEANEEITVISKLKNNVFMETTWYIIPEAKLLKYSDFDLLIWGFYYGLLFILLFYNINNYLILKNKIFVFYCLIAISSALQLSSYNGFAYMINSNTIINNLLMWIFLPLTTVFMLLFARYLFLLKVNMPFLNKTITFLNYFLIIFSISLSTIYLFFQDSHLAFMVKQYSSIGMLIYFIPSIIGIMAIKKKLKGAIFYTIGQGFHSVSIGYIAIYNNVADSFSFTTLYFPLIGSMVDLFFLSFALIQYFKYLKIANERNEKILISQSAFSNIGKSIGHITHQWRHPISKLNGSIMVLESNFIHNKKDFFTTFETQLPLIKNYIENLNNTLLDFSSLYTSPTKQSQFNPLKCIENIIHLLKSKIILKNTDITTEINDDFILYGNENLFSNVMLILIDNSLDAFQYSLDNKVKITVTQNNDNVLIKYEDNAGGITINPIENVFDYFTTTKNDDTPHGFGLAIAKLIIEEQMNGKIKVKNTSNGVIFTIKIQKNNFDNIILNKSQ